MATPAIAASTYARLARLTDPAAGQANAVPGIGTAAGDGQSFTAMLKDAVGAVAQAGRASDAQSQSLVAGKANLVDVVTAVAETETAIDTVVSVRDKVIAAYQQIMQMQI
jgi:flagellar hook-basal body complex protein FliE